MKSLILKHQICTSQTDRQTDRQTCKHTKLGGLQQCTVGTYASILGIPSVSTVYGAPVTVDFCTGDVIMGKPLPEVVYSSVLLIFVRCRTQTQLNHTFIVVGWMGERGGGREEGRGEEGREEGIKKVAAMWVAVN